MQIKDYQKIIRETAIYPDSIGPAYCAMGISDEAGEVSGKIKKLYRDRDLQDYPSLIDFISSAEGGFEVQRQIKKELGDVLWYITAMANEAGITLEEVMEANYNKLIKRRETNTLQGDGDDREEKTDV